MPNFPCKSDLEFYQSKRTPAWAKRIEKPPASISTAIDTCVNAHAGFRYTKGELAAHNLLTLIRGAVRRNQDLRQCLLVIANHPECLLDPHKRASFARKWARRV